MQKNVRQQLDQQLSKNKKISTLTSEQRDVLMSFYTRRSHKRFKITNEDSADKCLLSVKTALDAANKFAQDKNLTIDCCSFAYGPNYGSSRLCITYYENLTNDQLIYKYTYWKMRIEKEKAKADKKKLKDRTNVKSKKVAAEIIEKLKKDFNL